MKKILTYALFGFFFLCNTWQMAFAQVPILLEINNKLNSDSFKMNFETTNNISNPFSISRLEYYISNIAVVHDGGKRDTFKDTYILANPSGAKSTYVIGNLTYTNIEAIQFAIGVNKEVNNSDPTQYFPTHPLSPKSPSMHWGWTAGYRFLAIEGKSGTNLARGFEFHSMWNENYFTQEIPVTAKIVNGNAIITLNADYNLILKDIVLTNGPVYHGDNTIDLKALENLRDFVFTNQTGGGNILNTDQIEINNFALYPNPLAVNEKLIISGIAETHVIKAYEINGKLAAIFNSNEAVKFDKAGVYYLEIMNQSGVTSSSFQKIIVF